VWAVTATPTIGCSQSSFIAMGHQSKIAEVLSMPLVWFGLGTISFAIAILAVISLGTPYSILWPAVDVVLYFDPTIDAPDNWAWALHYIYRVTILLIAFGCGCGAIGFWRSDVQQKTRRSITTN
jgi:hypothetical protein